MSSPASDIDRHIIAARRFERRHGPDSLDVPAYVKDRHLPRSITTASAVIESEVVASGIGAPPPVGLPAAGAHSTDPGAHVQRRDLLRWTGYLAAVALVGCRPAGEPLTTGTAAGHAAAPPRPQPPRQPRSAPAPAAGQRPVAPADEPVEEPPEELAGDDPAADEPPPDEPAAEPEPPADDPEPTEPEPPPEDPPEETDEPEEPTATSVHIEVICRDALGLVAAGSGARSHTISRLTLHHTAVPLGANRNAPSRLRGHQRFHQDNDWADIAYHYGIDLRGNVYELRDVGLAGDTFTNYDPAGHFLVVCEGDYDQERPSDAMLQATAALLAHGASRFGVSPDTLTGHRDHAATSCPGANLYNRLGDLRRETARLTTASVTTVSLCGSAGRDRVAAIEAG